MQKAVIAFIVFYSTLFASDKLNITASILPQKYFVKKIAGNNANINIMVTPGSSPAIYEPKPKQMAAISKTDIYFSIGVPFERVWLKKFKAVNKDLNIVDTSFGISKMHISSRSHKKKAKILDPHIWLSPRLVKIQTKNIADALIKAQPNKKALFKKNLKSFLSEIEALDKNIKEILKDIKKKKFMVFHPTWGYFAKDYGLVQISIEKEGKEPKPAQLAKLIKAAKEEHIKVIFVQSQFSKKSAKTIAKSINGRVVAIDPLSAQWDKNLLKVAKIFKLKGL